MLRVRGSVVVLGERSTSTHYVVIPREWRAIAVSLTSGILRLYMLYSSNTMVRMDASFWAKHGNLQWLKTKCYISRYLKHRRSEQPWCFVCIVVHVYITKQLQYLCCNYDINNMITFVCHMTTYYPALFFTLPSDLKPLLRLTGTRPHG